MITTVKTSKHQQPNTGFSTELELVNKFTALFSSKKIHIEHEFDSGFGIADIVFLKNYNNQKFLQQLGSIDPNWAYTLRSLPYRKNFDLEFLIKISGSSRSASMKALQSFIDAGYCILKPTGFYEKIKQPRAITTNLTAIEAKLSDWRRAIWQASRYKTFADYSFVLLDKKHANPAIDNLQEFKKFNIGLLVFSTIDELEIFFQPKKESKTLANLYWKAHAKLAKNISL